MSKQDCPKCRGEMVWAGFQEQRYWYCRTCKKELSEMGEAKAYSPGAGWGEYKPTVGRLVGSVPNPQTLPRAMSGATVGGCKVFTVVPGNTPCYIDEDGDGWHFIQIDKLLDLGLPSRVTCVCGSQRVWYDHDKRQILIP